jgi:hypothetical protein
MPNVKATATVEIEVEADSLEAARAALIGLEGKVGGAIKHGAMGQTHVRSVSVKVRDKTLDGEPA